LQVWKSLTRGRGSYLRIVFYYNIWRRLRIAADNRILVATPTTTCIMRQLIRLICASHVRAQTMNHTTYSHRHGIRVLMVHKSFQTLEPYDINYIMSVYARSVITLCITFSLTLITPYTKASSAINSSVRDVYVGWLSAL